MFPYTFEVVTAITLTVIGIILVLYFIVLKRKGWLTENSRGSFYRCPNPGCKKIFQKPTMLTDLSETPASIYPACPHCGFKLERVSPFPSQKKTEMATEVPPSPKKRLEEPTVSIRTPEPANSVGLTEIRGRPKISVETQESPEVPSERIEAPRIPKEEQPPTILSKHTEARPPGCPKFFGYLKRIPKNASLPDECFRCPKMVECLYYTFSE